jgi:hypothetical protein
VLRRGRGGGKRAAGPETHRELSGGVSLAGGWPEASNLGGGAQTTVRKIWRIGGDSGHLGSILRARRKRAASRTFSAHRRGWGEHGTAALGGGHGGSSSFTGSMHGREEGRPGRGKKRRGRGSSWRTAASSGGLLGGQSEQEVARPRPGGLHAPLPVTQQRKRSAFANSPLALGSFPEKFKTELVCIV